MQEVARRRELERLLAFSAPRDSTPVAWRRALRFMFLLLLADRCHSAEPGAYALLRAVTNPPGTFSQ